jgi:hypothetical protein
MKIVLNHVPSEISNALKTNTVYLNKNGVITECKGILYNETIIKMVPTIYGHGILLAPEDEVYYITE